MIVTDAMLAAYWDCALWSTMADYSDDSDGEALDATHDMYDVAGSCRRSASDDMHAFCDGLPDDVEDYWDPTRVGHDFWLTRNGHGTGFWDRYSDGRGAELGTLLSERASVYGGVDLYADGDTVRGHD